MAPREKPKPHNAVEGSRSIVDGVDPGEVAQRVPGLDKLPPEERIHTVELILEQVAGQATFSGPLPPPQMLKGYEEVLPGLADRITAMAEDELEHGQAIQQLVLQSEMAAQARDHTYRLIGMATAFLALGGMLGLVAYLAAIGQGALAAAFGFTSMAAIIWMFIAGRPARTAAAKPEWPPQTASRPPPTRGP